MNDHQDSITPLQELHVSPAQIVTLIGQRLKQARRQSATNLTDLSARLKISRDKLIAMEEGTLDMPHSIFLRGMLRSYAKVVGANIDAELAALGPMVTIKNPTLVNQPNRAPFKPYALRHEKFLSQTRKFIMWSLFIVFMSTTPAYILWIQIGNSALPSSNAVTYLEHSYPPKAEPASTPALAPPPPATAPEELNPVNPATATPTIPAELPTIDNMMLHRLTENLPPVENAAAVNTAANMTTNTNTSTHSTTNKIANTVSHPGGPKNANAATNTATTAANVTDKSASMANGAPLLSIKFNGESWYEVTSATGKILSTGVGRNGDIQQIRHTPPIKLVLGNTHGIAALEFRGKRVDLEAPRGGVARLILE